MVAVTLHAIDVRWKALQPAMLRRAYFPTPGRERPSYRFNGWRLENAEVGVRNLGQRFACDGLIGLAGARW